MYKKNVLLPVVSVLIALVITACSAGAPAVIPAPVTTNTPNPPTDTPPPTFTVTATIEPTIEPTITPTATVAPTATLTDIIPYADALTFNDPASGFMSSTSDLWYFIGQQGQVFNIVLDGQGNNYTFTLRDEQNKSLMGCTPIGAQCSIEGYRLPYTGVYYILIDTLLRNVPNLTMCSKSPPPTFCYVTGSYTLSLAPE